MRFSLRRQPCFAPILTPCVADSRQRHALAVSVFNTATRFAASTDPVRFASPTADARRPGADALFSTTRGQPPPLRAAYSPTHQVQRHVLTFRIFLFTPHLQCSHAPHHT